MPPDLWIQPLSAAPESEDESAFGLIGRSLYPDYFIAGGLFSVRVFVPVIDRHAGATDGVVSVLTRKISLMGISALPAFSI